ncbi:MAG TPA: phosphoribosylformylglycinamidine synthase I [Candidatus Aquilonibacter sp.]|nr:phosphoribosylformylglycinamidine synthase I [Candidatus Aquilonibacter sp.]
MSKRIAVLVFPGTNSEEETLRLLRDCGGDAHLVHWSRASLLPKFDAYVLPGGFAYEDRIRAGAIAAHDEMMDYVIEGAREGKLVLGVCNGAQILLEAGLVPGTGEVRRPTAAFTRNGPVPHFICTHVWVKLAIDPARSPITAGLHRNELIPAWAAHGEGRLAADETHLRELDQNGHVAFVYAHPDGHVDASATPNQSALNAAALVNKEGNVLAIMPHPERDGWTFNHPDRRGRHGILEPSGGAVFFRSFVAGVHAR